MRRYILFTIIALAAVLRLYKLDSYPVSISWDEAAIGYNAYSIAQTKRDEYGKKLPILFQSFNDYKLPGYIYLDAAVVKIFGLSNFTVRLPSALAGVLSVILIYFLTKKLFMETRSEKAALLAALLLAISPWHLQFSRAAFEANVSLTIVLSGIVLLFYGLKNRTAALFAIPVLFFSLYFYYSPRIFLPPILVAFFIIYKKEVLKNLKIFIIGLLLAIIISLPIISKTISTEGQKRVREVSVFSDPSLAQTYSETRLFENLPLENIILNQRIPYVMEVLKNYASHFSPKFLFFVDDPNPRHRTPYQGNLYLFEVVTILLGVWSLTKIDSKIAKFLLLWLSVAPISASAAKDSPHALRAFLMLIPLVILSAIGADKILKKQRFAAILSLVAVLFFLNYLIGYYFIYPQRDSISWAYGYRQLYQKLNERQNADSIIVTGHYWKPYIFYLYYNKVDPNYYWIQGVQEKIGKYNFGTTYWDSGGRDLEESDIEKAKGNKTILALSPSEYESLSDKSKFKNISEVYDYSGKTILFKIGEWQ